MKNISKLESGNTYSLSQIFSKDFVIAIPDLQRDYCWGLETYDKNGKQQGELVTGFLSSLKNNWQERLGSEGFTPMGLIYGYEWPKGTYQLCDGQQRITTLFLLAGELYRNSLVSDDAKANLYNILVKQSVGEFDGAVTSGLIYSIRETTVYFLSDLISNYLLSDNSQLPFYSLEDRQKYHSVLRHRGRPAWYFLEYDNDPTIQSMLGAIFTIQKFLEESFCDSISISSFAKVIANQFSFIYYDMGNRMRGEETFVVLNTTGEPLTTTENLKPLLIAGLPSNSENEKLLENISKQWEIREDWFWKHKTEKELTSDELSRDFYTWWLLTYGEKESVNLIKDYLNLDLRNCIIELHSFYQSLISVIKWINESLEAKSILSKVSEWTDERINCSSENHILSWLRISSHREILLPLLAFHNKFGERDLLILLRRLVKNYYIGKTTKGENDPNHLRPYIKFRDLINIIKHSEKDSDVFSDGSWYNYDEQQKVAVFTDSQTKLIEFELDDNLRFDLNVLWASGVDNIGKAEFVRKRLADLHQLAQGKIVSDYVENIAISMSNKYRILRFLKGWGHPNGKQVNVNWKQWGTWFTWDRYSDNLSRAYNDPDMWKLLSDDNLNLTLSNMTREVIKYQHSIDKIFSPQSFSKPNGIMRAWLISKFLINERMQAGPLLITIYDDYPLCVNKEELDENKINRHLPMSIGNICLHHVNRNGPWKVQMPYYKESTCLDSPLYAGILEVSHKNYMNGDVSEDLVNQTTYYILNLFDEYIGTIDSSVL